MRRACLLALACVCAVAFTPTTSARAASTAVGWKLIASDDFTGSSLGSDWGAYGGSYIANAWSANDVSVSGGMLHLTFERRSTAGKPFTSGGVGMWGLAQTYGRYEFQAKAPASSGIDSYITLWPPDTDSDADATLVELLAKPAVSPGAQAAYVTIGYGGGKNYATVAGDYTAAFHDYVIEWTPSYESVSVDGKVLLRSTQVSHQRRWIGFVMSAGDNLTGTPSAGTPLPAQFLIQHLRVYAYSPGAPPIATTTSASPKPTPTPTKTTAAPTTTAAQPTTAASTSASPAVVASEDVAPVAKSSKPSTTLWLAVAVTVAALAGGGLMFLRRRRPGQGTRRRQN